MKMMTTVSMILLSGFLLSACSGTQAVPAVAESKSLPSWYLSPPDNSGTYLYGTGEGANLEEAKKNALESMISQLGISISSNYQSHLNVHKSYGEFFTKETSFELKSEVSKIRISNYEVVEREAYRYNRFMVLVRSNKTQFTKALLKELNTRLERIEVEQASLTSSDPLSRYKSYDKSLRELKEMFSTVLVLNTLDATFDEQRYARVVSQISSKSQTLKESMTFSLSSDSSAQGFKEELQVGLSNEGKRIVQKRRDDKDHIVIEVHAKTAYAKAHGFDIARTVLLVEVQDSHAKVIGGNKIDLIGHSTQGETVALNDAVKKLHALIEKEGILVVVGVK